MDIAQTTELSTLRDWVRWAASRFNEAGLFFGHGTDNAFDEALTLVYAALYLQHEMPHGYLDTRLTASEKQRVFNLLKKRLDERVPAAYLTGEARFAGMWFAVNSHVLVPRSPIAELIEHGFEPWLPLNEDLRILDLCTGSGCIGLACAHYFPDAMVDLADISLEALEVAQANLERHQLEHQVNVIHSDLFDDIPPGDGYDLIVSNPPYVSADDMSNLPREYLYEPVLGLAAGDDGLDLVRRILADAGRYLKPNGILIVEVGASAEHLYRRYPQVPFLWLDFERGGDGVFLLTAEQIAEYQHIFDEEVG